jgi:hypothetical protein
MQSLPQDVASHAANMEVRMKRWCLLTLTLLVVGISWLVLSHLGWFRPRAEAAPVQAAAQDPLLSAPATRWRHAEPHHWRAYMLKQ